MGLSLGFIFMNIPPALDRLMDLYGASYLRISILISTLSWSHALMQVPAGMIGDRLGIRPALFGWAYVLSVATSSPFCLLT